MILVPLYFLREDRKASQKTTFSKSFKASIVMTSVVVTNSENIRYQFLRKCSRCPRPASPYNWEYHLSQNSQFSPSSSNRITKEASAGIGVMPVCSQCQSTIPAEDVNVASDVAFCRPCNRATRLSDLVSSSVPLMEFDPTNPPHGT